MKFISTRGFEKKYSAAEAILMGIAPDGGLFVPETIPTLSRGDIEAMKDMKFYQISASVLSRFLDDFSEEELLDYTSQAYAEEKWGENTVPLVQLNQYNDKEYILELWHGPTCAFKDVALQLLPHLMTASISKTGAKDKICILTATSGDTGSAVAQAFFDKKRHGDRVNVVVPIRIGACEMRSVSQPEFDELVRLGCGIGRGV